MELQPQLALTPDYTHARTHAHTHTSVQAALNSRPLAGNSFSGKHAGQDPTQHAAGAMDAECVQGVVVPAGE